MNRKNHRFHVSHALPLGLVFLFYACGQTEKAIVPTVLPENSGGGGVVNPSDQPTGTIPLDLAHVPAAPSGFSSPGALRDAWIAGQLKFINTPSERPGNVVEYRDLEYFRQHGQPLWMDLAVSASAGSRSPIVLLLHGESWSGSGSRNDLQPWRYRLAQKGYLAATPDYGMEAGCGYPQAVENISGAIAWLRANAGRYNADPGRIACIGFSDGGYIALMGALDAARKMNIQAVAAFSAPSDLAALPVGIMTISRDHFMGKTGSVPELLRQASPLSITPQQNVSVLLVHGVLDDLVPVAQSDALAKHLQTAGLPVYYERVEGWGCGIGMQRELADHVGALLEQFLTRRLSVKPS